jgi:glycosyltransferase involved in cell wall biosynthesis
LERQVPEQPGSAEIAVVMPHRGHDAYLPQAVRSILTQEGVSLRLYLVDDASPTDDWLKAIEPWRADPRLIVLQADRQVGPFRITNWVLENSTEPYIAFQDADDWSAPNRLRLQLDALQARRADIVGCGFFVVAEDGSTVRIRKMVRNVNRAHRRGTKFAFLHPTALLSRHVLRELGGFDGSDIGVGADTDFYLRATFACRMRNLTSPLYHYRQHPASLTAGKDTGHESEARAAYSSQIFADFNRRLALWRRRYFRLGLRRDFDLKNRPNDVGFTVRVPPLALVVDGAR